MCDLNSDLGEGFGAWSTGADDALLDLMTSANIACGFHAGDPSIVRRTCERAVDDGVHIGAHIGHRDLAGFGRRTIAIDPADLREETLYQIGALDAIAHAAGDRVRYVKPHGALYHSASHDPSLAEAITTAMHSLNPELVLLGPAGTCLEAAAESAGIPFRGEGFADRAYTSTGTLVPRGVAGAVLAVDDAVEQALALASGGVVSTIEATGEVAVAADSVCVHGDSPGALGIARAIRAAFAEAGIVVEAFT
jgi:5-oxoprolinase (ATP-hydrolysing) subunit A